jgi:hypothetical protein
MTAAAILTPILTKLASNGLGLLSNAIQVKGKEVIEAKLGVDIPTTAESYTPEVLNNLKQLEFEHEEFLVNAVVRGQADANDAVTKRWTTDIASDSWLAKNTRPITLLALLAVVMLLALLSAAGANPDIQYAKILEGWGMIVFGAYFVGRSAEKIKTTNRG